MKKVLIGFVALFSVFPLIAQRPALYFERLNRANGLSHDKVNCILKDQRGFIWIGTDDGLNRYDGHNFVVFKNIPGELSSISGNTITDLHEDKDGILWIATADGGITRYDYRLSPDKKFKQYKHHPSDSNSIPVNIVNAMEEDNDGNLWLATSGAAMIRFDKQKEKFLKPDQLGLWTIYDMSFDRNGIIWAGREGGSILKVNPKTLQWETDKRYINLYAALPHVVVTSLFKDSRENIWFGSWDKAVYRHNALTHIEESFVNNPRDPYSFGEDEALAFNEDRQGRIWIGGKDHGLYIFDPSTNRFYNYRHDPSREGTLSDNRVNSIFIDSSGMVWLGTNNGVSIFHVSGHAFEQQFISVTKADKPLVIYDFYKEKDGSLLIGTSKGLYIQNTAGEFQLQKLTYKGVAPAITKIFRDTDGEFYLGSDYTVFRYDRVRRSISALPNTDKDEVMTRLIESRIVSMVKDTIGNHPVLWVVPYGHYFAYYDFVEQRWVSRKDSTRNILKRYDLTDNLIRKIVRCSQGKLWLATAKHGLIILETNNEGNKTFINDPSEKGSISNNHVYDIKEDRKGNLWISTYGGGLNYFNTKEQKFNHYVSDNNLLEGLELDKQNNIWSISNGGLQKFNPRTATFTYSALPDIEKTGGVKGHIFKDQEGKMYVAGPGYFIAFEPEKIVIQDQQPEVFITDLSIFNKSFSHLLTRKKIELRHNQNFFTLHFAAPFYTASTPVQYSYMLEGVDKDWINTGASAPQAQYTNLSGGEYTFKVRATVTPGNWSEKIATLSIKIIPPFYKRGWFFVLMVALAAGIGYALYRYRINELVKRQVIRNKIAQDLHDNMGSTLSSISVYSQVAKIYKEKNRSDELQHTLEKISTISGEMISEMTDIVWAINPRNDSMETILQRMESYARPLLASQEIQFHFAWEQGLKQLNLDMTKRKNFYLIFKEAVNNALKYSCARNLWVSIRHHHQQLVLTIRDDGKGFDTAQVRAGASASLSGNGLQNMGMRAKEIGGEFQTESQPGEGTVLTLRFTIP